MANPKFTTEDLTTIDELIDRGVTTIVSDQDIDAEEKRATLAPLFRVGEKVAALLGGDAQKTRPAPVKRERATRKRGLPAPAATLGAVVEESEA